MPHGRDSGRQRRVGLSVDDAYVDRGLNSNLASPWRHIVTPPGMCGQVVNFSLLTFGLALFSKPVDLSLWFRQLHHRSDLGPTDQQSLIVSGDLPREAVAAGVDGCSEQLLDSSR